MDVLSTLGTLVEGVPDVVWDWAKAGGALGVLTVWVILERRERQAVQKRNDALTDALGKSATDSALALQRIYDLLSAGKK